MEKARSQTSAEVIGPSSGTAVASGKSMRFAVGQILAALFALVGSGQDLLGGPGAPFGLRRHPYASALVVVLVEHRVYGLVDGRCEHDQGRATQAWEREGFPPLKACHGRDQVAVDLEILKDAHLFTA